MKRPRSVTKCLNCPRPVLARQTAFGAWRAAQQRQDCHQLSPKFEDREAQSPLHLLQTCSAQSRLRSKFQSLADHCLNTIRIQSQDFTVVLSAAPLCCTQRVPGALPEALLPQNVLLAEQLHFLRPATSQCITCVIPGAAGQPSIAHEPQSAPSNLCKRELMILQHWPTAAWTQKLRSWQRYAFKGFTGQPGILLAGLSRSSFPFLDLDN